MNHKKEPFLFLLTVLLCSSRLIAQNATQVTTQSLDNNIVSNFILSSTSDEATEAHSITVGEYIGFLNATSSKEAANEFYSDAMQSQIVRTSDGVYSLAEDVDTDDLMQNLSPYEVMVYLEWSAPDTDAKVSPLMMIGGADIEDPAVKKADPRGVATRGTKEAGAGGGSSSSASQSARSGDGIVAFREAATQVASHARENLTVDSMPGGDAASRESRIHAAIEASTIADMLSSYVADSVAKKRATGDNTPLFPIEHERTITPLQKAAAWEATVNESLLIARDALETARKNHTDVLQKVTELHSAVSSSANDAKEAFEKRSEAVANVKSGALQAGGAAVGLAFGNPGPLVAEGVNLGVAVGGAALAHLDVRKTAAEVAEATDSLDYTNAKVGVLAKIKERAEALYGALVPLQEEATHSFENQVKKTKGIGTIEERLSVHRNKAEENASPLRITHAQNLIAWATDKLTEAESAKNNNDQIVAQKQEALDKANSNYQKAPFGRAEKESNAKEEAEAELKKAQTNLNRSQRAINSLEHYKTQAEGILEALQSRSDWAEIKTEAVNELEEARKAKTALESALRAATEEYERVKAEWKATSNVNSLLYPQKKLNKDAAKAKRTKCETDVEEAALTLAQAEKAAQSATQDLASIDARLSIWDNLRAWHTVVFSSHLKSKDSASKTAAVEEKPSESPDMPSLNPLSITPKAPGTSQVSKAISQESTSEKIAPLDPSSISEDRDSERDEPSNQKMPQQTGSVTEAPIEDFSDDIADASDEIRDQLATVQLSHLAANLAEENKERERIFRLKKAGKTIEPAVVKKSSSPADTADLDTELDNETRNRLMIEYAAYAADETGAIADGAINRLIAVKTGEAEDSSLMELPPPVVNPIGAAVKEALITRERFNLVDQTTKGSVNALAACKKAAEERKKNQAAKLALLKK